MHGRRLIAISALAALSAISVPAQEAAQPQTSRPAKLSRPARRGAVSPPVSALARVQGSALTAQSAGLPQAPVRLRDARYGRVVRTRLTDDHGFFAFPLIDPGSYVVELLDERQQILAASQLVSVNAADVASVVVREPLPVTALSREASHSDSHLASITSAAAASGILATRPPKDDVSPR